MPLIRAHHDADGLTSAHFATFGISEGTIEFPKSEEFGDTKGLSNEDWMVDMKPKDPTWGGNVIDHHFPHPKERKYKLIPELSDDDINNSNAIVPASLITWNHFKEKIPKEEWWKLCIGLGGDGQLELTPNEVFQQCPTLLKYVSTSVYQSYGQWKVSTKPLYETLSSSINAFLRQSEYEQAINIIRYASTPIEVYDNDDVKTAKSNVRNEFSVAVKDSDIIHFDNLALVIFHSKYRMSGYIASALQKELDGKTIMAINKRDGSISLRGNLACLYKEKLSKIPYVDIDGHRGFMGGKLKKNYSKLIADLSEIL
jgi:hypothetical protein